VRAGRILPARSLAAAGGHRDRFCWMQLSHSLPAGCRYRNAAIARCPSALRMGPGVRTAPLG